jgi:hypothetical protein
VVIAAVPPRRVNGRSRRASCGTPRQRKLSSEQEATIRALVQTRSLHSLAAEFGVSHETVRAVLRASPAAAGGSPGPDARYGSRRYGGSGASATARRKTSGRA